MYSSVVDPDPHQIEKYRRIQIRIRNIVISWIRSRIKLQMTSQSVWNHMSLFEHFFKVLSLYLEARIWISIKFKGRIRIRIRIKVTNRTRIRIKVASRILIRIHIKVMRIRNTVTVYTLQ
jgi:hypothetical protein